MPNKLFISKLNPVKFHSVDYSQPARYNTRDMDNFRYQDTLSPLDEPVNFFQPFQQTDIIPLQFLTTIYPIVVYLVKCDGELMGTFNATFVGDLIDLTGLRPYEVTIPLNTYADGNYYLRMTAGAPVGATWESEVFSLGSHPLSVLFEYSHGQNDFDVLFETDIRFQYRSYGALREFTPGMDRTVFIDQPQNLVQLSARNFAARKLFIGISTGVADHVIERVAAIFQCDTVLIDGKQYGLPDNATFEAARDPLYPLAGWSIDVRPAKAGGSLETIVDPSADVNIMYAIEQGPFGGISTPAGTNIIQIRNNG